MSAAQSSIYSVIKNFIGQELDLGNYSSLFLTTVPPKPGEKIVRVKKESITPKKEKIVAERKEVYKPKHIPKIGTLKTATGSKKSQLDELKSLIGKCDMCPELANYRKNIVFGAGNPDADVLFVGEAPGRDEDVQGVPFVGRSGRLLTDIIEKGMSIKREDVYIANILKCRPPENRDPLPDEIKAHTPWLLKQIGDMKPKVVCSLGNYATKFFLAGGNVDEMKSQPGITQVHGNVREIEMDDVKFKLIPLFHPAAIIYNRTKLTPLWEADMEVVKKEIRNN